MVFSDSFQIAYNVKVEAENLSYSYNGGFRLEPVSFKIRSHEVFMLLGPNGSGKTTILRCISGLYKDFSGRILIDGKPIQSYNSYALARLLAVVPQEHHPSFPYRLIDFVVMGRAPYHGMLEIPSSRDYKLAYEILNNLSLEKFSQRPYTTLSGGERQLALIARALTQEPKILLLDEPTAHLDFKNQVLILKTIVKLAKERNMTVVMTLHDPNLASLYADTVLLLGKGESVAYGKPEEVLEEENLRKAYGINPKTISIGNLKIVLPV
jgi:iron complex transport system ATP-binding protein